MQCSIDPMRGRPAWIAAALALGAALLLRSRRPLPLPGQAEERASDPRAEELRRRLEESRTLVEEREEFESAETTVDNAQATGGDLEERRRRIHDEGRIAAERMRGPSRDDED